MKLGLYWNYATRSLIRSGQRTVLAIFCIAIGVMAIVALQLVGQSINQALTGNVRAANGGDIQVSTIATSFHQKDYEVVQNLKQQGQITDFATANDISSSITLDDGSIVNLELFAVSSNFPLVDDANYTKPSSSLHTRDLLKGNDVVVDTSTFDALHAHIGQQFPVKLQDGRIANVTIKAVYASGNGFGSGSIYMSADALNAIPDAQGNPVPPLYTSFYITAPSGNITAVTNQLNNQIPTGQTRTTADLLKQRQDQVNNIRLFLQIVGLLSLFIGGIGIINTMQVLLRRRRVEIAMLKTTGYRQSDLYGFFGLEAALLGLIGGILGSLLAIGASNIVRGVVANAFNINLPVVLDGFTIFSGIFIGFATALIFGILPIVQASQVRPLSVLREIDEGSGRASWLLTGGLLALLLALFIGLADFIIGDVTKAILVVLGGAGLLFALAGGFSLLVFAISKLPIYERPNARILLWILAAFGILLGAAIAAALLGGVGFALNLIGAKVGGAFGSVAGYIQTVMIGFGVVLFGGAGVFFVATIIDALVMFFPNSWKTAVMLAFRNMGRQRIRTTITLTALFVGVFAIGVVLLVGQGIKDAINGIIANTLNYNVFVLAPDSQHNTLAQQIPSLPGVQQNAYTDNPVVVNFSLVSINGIDASTVLANLPKTFRDANHIGKPGVVVYLGSMQGYNLTGAKKGDLPDDSLVLKTNGSRNLQASDAGTNNVLVSSALRLDPLDLKVGDSFVLQTPDGRNQEFHIVGFWNADSANLSFAEIYGDATLARQLGGSQTLDVYSVKVDTNKIVQFRKDLNTAVPTAQTVSVTDFIALINQVLNGLISMLTTIASLALLAGLIIIANAVALAMLERRREIGILKSVGHTSGSILATVLLENGLVGALGALVAMLLVSTLLALLSAVSHVTFSAGPGVIFLIIASSAIVTMIISGLVAYSAARVRPLEVLRYE